MIIQMTHVRLTLIECEDIHVYIQNQTCKAHIDGV